MTKLRHLALFFALGLAPAMLGHAAEKPDPTPLDTRPKGVDMEGFKSAYQRAGEPRFLIMVGNDDLIGTPKTGASGNDIYGKAIFLPWSGTGDPQALKSAIEGILLADKTIELINQDSIEEVDRHQFDLLNLRDEGKAVQMLASKTKAEIVVKVHLISGHPVAQRNAKYRVNVELIQATRGRTIGTFSFDWREGVEAEDIKDYGRAVTRKVVDDFVSWYSPAGNGTASNYTIRMIGLSDIAQYRKVRTAFEKIQGVAKVRDGEANFSKTTSVSSMIVRYSGRPLDLLYEMQELGSKELNLKFQGTDGNAGSITLVAPHVSDSAGPNGDSLGARLINPEHPGHLDAISTLTAAYQNSSAPRVGVIVNRELNEEERKNPEIAKAIQDITDGRIQPIGPAGEPTDAKGAVYVTFNASGDRPSNKNGSGNGDSKSRDGKEGDVNKNPDDPIDTRRMEDYLYKHLIRLHINMVDPEVARAEVQKEADKARTVYRENELVFLLGRAAKVDIVIRGFGRMEKKKNGPTAMTYTFRAVRVSDGVTLAAEGYSVDLSTDKAVEDFVVDKVSQNITASLVEQMVAFWQPPRTITVHLYNAKTPRDVATVMSILQNKLPKISRTNFESHDGGKEGGVGQFTIQYNDSYETLIREISKLNEGDDVNKKLPFDFDTSKADPNNLTLKLRDGA